MIVMLRTLGVENIPRSFLKKSHGLKICKLMLCTQASSTPGDTSVEIKYVNGLAKFKIPLPSRSEMCGFTLKPVTNNVGDFIKMLQTEDKGIDRAAVFDNNGVRIASSCNIEALLDEPFCIQINNILYRAEPPAKEKLNVDNLSTLGNVKNLVGQLYEALQVDEHYAKKEKELIQELETLKQSISPLEAKRNELNEQAARNTNLKTWLGLGLMSVQFGILARLTWWEYSWDIMEPVTFFVGYGTSIALYAYFCMTKMEYNYNDVANRHYLLSVYKSAKIKGLDVEEYNNMKRKIAEVEFDLKRLKDPLYLQLPPHFQKSTPPSKQRSRIEDND